MKKRQAFIGLCLVAIVLGLFLFFAHSNKDQDNQATTQSNPTTDSTVIDDETPVEKPKSQGEKVTVEAEGTCLPHQDADGPQTMECAMGIKTDDGTYYAIKDETNDYALVSKIQTGKRSRISGTLVKEESETYQSKGTLTVTAVEDI